MTTKNNFKELPNKEIYGGIQYKAKFPNGYGASIIKHNFSYGSSNDNWELAVLDDKGLCYTT